MIRPRRIATVARLFLLLVVAFAPVAKGAAPASGPATAPTTPPTAISTTPSPLPGAVNTKSLGFGSSRDDAEKLLGQPTRVVPISGGVKLYYGLSSLTLHGGKITGWCPYHRPLPMNIGAAIKGAPPVIIGSTVQQIVAAKGTPRTVAYFVDTSIWFYTDATFTLKEGKVITPQSESRSPLPATTQSKASFAPLEVSVERLLTAYQENSVDADKTYRDRRLLLTGIVKRVAINVEETPFVVMDPGEKFYFQTILCYFDSEHTLKLAKLEGGQSVVIEGICKGQPFKSQKSIDVVLDGCVVRSY